MNLNYDLYSMLFVSVMHYEYIWEKHLVRFRKERGRAQDVGAKKDDDKDNKSDEVKKNP